MTIQLQPTINRHQLFTISHVDDIDPFYQTDKYFIVCIGIDKYSIVCANEHNRWKDDPLIYPSLSVEIPISVINEYLGEGYSLTLCK